MAIVIAGAAVGAIADIAAKRPPGFLLGLFVVAATACAALVVRPGAGRVILPVPALSYLVAALVTGMVTDRPANSTHTAELISAAQWVADGFFAMALATALAIVLTTVRWYLWRRSRTAARAPGRSAPQQARGRRRRDGAGDDGDVPVPAEWGQPDPRAGRAAGWAEEDPRRAGQRAAPQAAGGAAGRRPGGPQPGSGSAAPRAPYNFSNGA